MVARAWDGRRERLLRSFGSNIRLRDFLWNWSWSWGCFYLFIRRLTRFPPRRKCSIAPRWAGRLIMLKRRLRLSEEGLRLSRHHQFSQEKHDLMVMWALIVLMPKLVTLPALEICSLVGFPCTSLCKAVPMRMSIFLAERAKLESPFPPFAFDH